MKSIVVKILDGDGTKKKVVFNTDDYSKIDELVRIYFPDFNKVLDWKLEDITFFDISKPLSLTEMDEKLRPLEDVIVPDLQDIIGKFRLLGFNNVKINPQPTYDKMYHGTVFYGGRSYRFDLYYTMVDENIKVKKISVGSSLEI